MNNILIAIELVREWNKKTLDEVAKEIEEYTGEEILKEDLEEFRFTGLNNIDFIKSRLRL